MPGADFRHAGSTKRLDGTDFARKEETIPPENIMICILQDSRVWRAMLSQVPLILSISRLNTQAALLSQKHR